MDWPDSKGLNEWERKALELAGEQSKLPGVIEGKASPWKTCRGHYAHVGLAAKDTVRKACSD